LGGVIDCGKIGERESRRAHCTSPGLPCAPLGADRFNCRRIGPRSKFLRCRAHDDLVDVDIGYIDDALELLLVGDIEQIGARTAAGAGDLRDDLVEPVSPARRDCDDRSL
jgi:hypothetical protein